MFGFGCFYGRNRIIIGIVYYRTMNYFLVCAMKIFLKLYNLLLTLWEDNFVMINFIWFCLTTFIFWFNFNFF